MPSFADNYYPLEVFACYWALIGNMNMKYQLELLQSVIKCKCYIRNQTEADLEQTDMLP